ncbi:ankyrin repeat family protein [Orientia chuto str. Dubai]|uniref:Ankyrin repeat family protein n=1 Tax=Orientia chuto str. Dubai TaxID=1359168 RepID=A0A0F3MIC9_9RICK|nr:ankyrin repeat domain-containing protein [Candidatus Orientia mediorientalis]KJV55510.1 ankyrin repeat family protein [Orientia chuto str. Dubai]
MSRLYQLIKSNELTKADVQKYKQDLNDLVDRCYIALHWAAIKDNSKATNLLVGSGADLNIQSVETKLTALHMAAITGKASNARIIIDAGANLDTRDNNGKTAYDLALDNNYIDTANIITKKDIIKICKDTQILGIKLPSVALHLEESKLLVLNTDCIARILSYINDNDDLQSLKGACTIKIYADVIEHNINMQAIGESGEELYDNAQ